MSLFHSKTVADELIERLVEAGVERIYGIVGDSLNPVSEAIRRSGKIKWIHVRHEEAAAFAASAEAQLSGQLAVCAGSSGPGSLHLMNGLYDAHRATAPVLAIVSHIPSSEIGTSYFQETHPDRLFQECSHYCELISNANQMPRVLQIAMQTAVSLGGVGVIVLPGDIAAQKLPDETLAHGIVSNRPTIRPNVESLEKLAQMIAEAEKITLFCGAGCAEAHDKVISLAETLLAPVGYAYRGKQFVEYENSFAVGMSGLLGFGAAYEAMHECDLLILLGTDFPYPNFYPGKCRIVQVDIRPEHLGRRSRIDLGIVGDVRETLNELQPVLQPKTDRAFLDRILEKHREKMENTEIHVRHVAENELIHPEFVAAKINEIADDDAIITCDTGMCNVWMARHIKAARKRRLLASYSHGSMTNAVPYAVGAQFLYPARQVISMSGDGGLAMLLGELLTILQYDLPVKIVVFNNSSLAFVNLEMEVSGYKGFETALVNPNFADVAKAIGLYGVRIENPADVESGLREAFACQGAAVIDVVTDPNALSLPPHITAKQVEGYAVTMGKLILSGEVDEIAKKLRSNIRHGKEII